MEREAKGGKELRSGGGFFSGSRFKSRVDLLGKVIIISIKFLTKDCEGGARVSDFMTRELKSQKEDIGMTGKLFRILLVFEDAVNCISSSWL